MKPVSFDIETVKNELRFLTSGGSFKSIYQVLYYSALLKYITQQQLKNIGYTGVEKIATKKKMLKLADLGFLQVVRNNPSIFTSTAKTLQVLKLLGYDLKLLPAVPKGTGAEIYNTDVFVQALKLPNYYALLYPQFPPEKPYIIPDALLVLKEPNRYQLNFLEIEAEKPNWESHLLTKYEGYQSLSRDPQVYKYWKAFSGYLKLPCPKIEDFKFRVIIVGDIKKDWGKAFEFRSRLF